MSETPEYIKKLYTKLISGDKTYHKDDMIYLGADDAWGGKGETLFIRIVDPNSDEYVMVSLDDKGKPVYEKSYKGGKLNGRFAQFKSGNVRREGNYLDDVKDGVWTEYDVNGKVIKTVEWHNGLRHGKTKHYKVSFSKGSEVTHEETWENGSRVDEK